jgi:hypothetical protein
MRLAWMHNLKLHPERYFPHGTDFPGTWQAPRLARGAACQDQNLKARTSEFPDIDNEPQLLAKGTAA